MAAVMIASFISANKDWIKLTPEGRIQAKLYQELSPSATFYEYYKDSNYYFIYKDKIYCYKYDGEEEFFSTNLDGTDKKILYKSKGVTDGELRCAKFYLVYNNEAYYYTMYTQSINKINLETGLINTVIDSYDEDTFATVPENLRLLPQTLNNGSVLIQYYHLIADDDYVLNERLDLNTGKVANTVKTEFNSYISDYCYDFAADKVYYAVEEDTKFNIYENNRIIYNLNDKVRLMFIQNGSLYIAAGSRLYGYDFKKGKVDSEKEINMGDIKNISHGVLNNNYFYADGAIYLFDDDKLEFVKIMDNINKDTTDAVMLGKYVLLNNWANMLLSKGQLTIYNTETKKTDIYENIAHYDAYGNIIYLVADKNNKYEIKKVLLN